MWPSLAIVLLALVAQAAAESAIVEIGPCVLSAEAGATTLQSTCGIAKAAGGGDPDAAVYTKAEVDAILDAKLAPLIVELCTIKYEGACLNCYANMTCKDYVSPSQPPPLPPPPPPLPPPPSSPPPQPACSSALFPAYHPSRCEADADADTPCQGEGACPNGFYWIHDGTNGARRYYVDMDGSVTGRQYMMRYDTSWSQSSYFSTGEVCAGPYPLMQDDGLFGVAPSIGGSYSGAHGGCGLALTDPLGNFRAKHIRITDVSYAGNRPCSGPDFPNAKIFVGSVAATGGMTAYQFGANHYVGSEPFCLSSCSFVVNTRLADGTRSWDVTDASDYQFGIGTRAYSSCSGSNMNGQFKLWFDWDA